MLMTQEEAETKWCPNVRATLYVRGDLPDLDRPVDIAGHGINRIVTDDPELTARIQRAIDATGATKCLGSSCMAWRWSDPAEKYERIACVGCNGSGAADDDPGAACEHCDGEGAIREPYPTPGRRGYCGAFGKPEV